MEEKELLKLMKKGESEEVEFKESLQLRDEICETSSAFSNSKDIGKKTTLDLAEYIKKNTDSHIFPEIDVCKAEGKKQRKGIRRGVYYILWTKRTISGRFIKEVRK